MDINYLWAHIDLGKSQIAANYRYCKAIGLNHGDDIDLKEHPCCCVVPLITLKNEQTKGVFRLIEKDLDKDFIAKKLPLYKKAWSNYNV